jgi:uncharacterized Zn finger protein
LATNEKKHTGTCIDCGGPLELFELNIKKGAKIMKCESCGLFHSYRKDFLGGWKIIKVTKDPSHVLGSE